MISPNTEAKGSFAIIQLSRIGDVIQTLQAAIELKSQHPKLRLVLIARENFARPLEFKLKEAFDKIYYLNYKKLQITSGPQNLEKVMGNLNDFIDGINNEDIDICINLTYSKTSSYLSSLISSKYKLGLVRNERNEIVIHDDWSQFIYSNTMNGPYSPFNLVDIFKGILGTKRNSYSNEHRNLKTKKVIIHPFASQRKKRWDLGKWSEVIYQILKSNNNAKVIIMGSSGESDDARKITENPILEKFEDRIIDLVGKTSIQELYNEFKDASLFVGHDSMGGHLASLYSVQTLTLSLGTVRPYETTPYGHKNYNIAPRIKCFPCFPEDSCELLPCHGDISYKVVSNVINSLLTHEAISYKSLAEKTPVHLLDKVDIYQSVVDSELGLFHLRNILHDENTTLDIFRSLYFVLWNFILSEKEVNVPYPKLTKDKYRILERHLEAAKQLREINQFGKVYSKGILDQTEADSPDLQKIKSYSQKLVEVDRLCMALKEPYPHLAPAIDYYHVSKANIPGTTLKEMSQFSLVAYLEAENASAVLCELIEGTMKSSPFYQEEKSAPKPELSNS